MKLNHFAFLSVFVIAGVMPLTCGATSIQLGINGDAEIGSGFIDFGQYPQGPPYAPGLDYGTFEVSLVNASIFSAAGITPGESGRIQSLNEGTGAITLETPFMTFDAGGSNLQLWITNMPAGSDDAVVFTNTPDGAVASFDVKGYVFDVNTNRAVESLTGTFSTTFVGDSTESLLEEMPVDSPISATFTAEATPISNAPEPASLLLLAVGLFGLSALPNRTRK